MVPENDTALSELTNKGLIHGVSGNDTTVPYLGGYGGEQYGNTISTGFFTERSFADENNSVRINGTWTIYIPASGTYFKITDGNKNSYENIAPTPVVTDSPEVANNQGAIYRAESSTSNYNRQVKVHVNDSVTITGSGAVVFGIVVDDLYAPNAYAGFKLGKTEGINLDDNNSVIADEEHEYDQSKLDAIGSTSSTDTQTID